MDKKTFDKQKILASEGISPNSKFYIESGDFSNFEKIVEIQSQKRYVIKPEKYATKTFNSKWSPDGTKIAFLYKKERKDSAKDNFSDTATLSEVITQNFSDRPKSNLPSAEIIDFAWIDGQSILVSQLNYISQLQYYHGNIGVYEVNSDKFRIIITSITQKVPYINTLRISADGKFFTYQISEKLGEEQIIISDLKGREIKKLSGRDPSWQP